MIKSIIVEDEPIYSTKLLGLLKKIEEPINVLSITQNINDSLEAIEKFQPELIFLDIELGTETGFDLLKKANKINFDIIFTTAHIDKNIRGIRSVGLSYLPKPIILSELEEAIRKFKSKQSGYDRVMTLKTNLEATTIDDKAIWINDNNGNYFPVKVKDILYGISNNQYTNFFMQRNDSGILNWVSAKGIGVWEDDLEPFRFCRIHNKYLINIRHVVQYTRGEGGTVKMSNGELLDVSKDRKNKFLKISGIK